MNGLTDDEFLAVLNEARTSGDSPNDALEATRIANRIAIQAAQGAYPRHNNANPKQRTAYIARRNALLVKHGLEKHL